MKITAHEQDGVSIRDIVPGTLTWCQQLGYCIYARTSDPMQDYAVFVNVIDGTVNKVTRSCTFKIFPNAAILLEPDDYET